MHEERKHNEEPWGSCGGLTPQVAGHSRSFPTVHVHTQPRVAPIRTHTCTRTHSHSCAHTLSSSLNGKHPADGWPVTCSAWVRENVYEGISLTPNLLPPLPHKPHSKVIQRATEVHFCICFYFLFLAGEETLLWFCNMLHRLCAGTTSKTLPVTPCHHAGAHWCHL